MLAMNATTAPAVLPSADVLAKVEDAIERALEQAPVTDVLAVVTGAFVGLMVEVVRRRGLDTSKEINVDGGVNRDITIHPTKDQRTR
jgi:hypothetical protein